MTRHRFRRTALALAFPALVLSAQPACQTSGGGGAAGAGTGGGAGTSGGAGTAGGAAGQGGSDAGADTGDASGSETLSPAAACPEDRVPLRQSGGTLALAIDLRLAGKPFVFGEPNAVPAGGSVTPLDFRFYVSHVALLKAAGAPVPVDLVTAAGAPEPFGVHLYNAEDPTSQTLRVLAPPGDYTGVAFTFGIDDACNAAPGPRHAPFHEQSLMLWPHLAGYLFLRYEARVSALGSTPTDAGADAATDAGAALGDAAQEGGPGDAGGVDVPTKIHMGGVPGHLFAPTVEARGAITIVASPPMTRSLRLDVGALMDGATMPGDPATLATVIPFPEAQAGERLREHATQLPLFTLAP